MFMHVSTDIGLMLTKSEFAGNFVNLRHHKLRSTSLMTGGRETFPIHTLLYCKALILLTALSKT
jgi:hypothetical protein